EWSTYNDFSSIAGESILEGIKTLTYTVTGLVTGLSYYVRVSAYNMKGWGPPQSSTPPSAAPSYWGDIDKKEVRRRGRLEILEQLLSQVKSLHQHCPCHENVKVQVPGRKHSMSKSLKHLFQPTSKFVKSLKRGLYLAAILYKDDDVVVTHEEQVPVVKADDSYSSSLMQDFLWFMKVSYMWEDSRWLAQCMTPSSLSCSSGLQARHNMLVAVTQLQGLLGTQELGQLYFEPIKDRQGNVLIVTMRELSSQQSLENVRWIPLAKIQNQRKSLSAADEPTALDILLSTLHEKVAFHRQSHEVLAPGLYLGYLKLCSSVDQIRVLVSQKLPNILCHVKIRNNHNVSRDEWEWLQMFRSLDEASPMDPCEESPQTRFQEELRAAVPELVKRFAIPLQQVKELRLYSQEVLEFAGDLSFLLLLPPSDDVCTAPGQNSPCPRPGLLTLPLQTFELVHFFTYDRAFIRQYCQVSALLELDLLLSQQALREAFSDSEVVAAKQRLQQVQDLIQKMEEVWREVRWIMDVLQYARYKQPPGGIPLCWLLNFTGERGKEQPQITPASPDYLPSPSPSPETKHRYLSPAGGSPTTADEEGSSEVFLTMSGDSDSRAQSHKELDLIPSSTANNSRRLSLTLAEGAPDVLRAHGPQSQKDTRHLLFHDSDFVPPSRQIELLHITEKRQAYCVRTSSLDVPAQPFHTQRNCWSRAESLHESPMEHNSGGSGTKGYLLNQVHPERTPESKGPTEWIALTQSSLEKEVPPKESQQLNSMSLSVYPQYQTGLAKEMSVKLCISSRTSAREIVTLVIRETNEAVRRMRGRPGILYREDQLEHFGLVLLMDNTEKWIQDDVSPLSLQNPWTKGRLCVRMRECSPLLPAHGTATAV
ncbi:ankyrin-repeat and fibronectin type III domain-containing 1, partial [Mobula hypostoma]|uniref:ankyrin-repeat and fibronectin type III domain-containing 1 n=1 Tax=Mobula hypostoma TaxID=723540 RepID=UPI002FC3B2CF